MKKSLKLIVTALLLSIMCFLPIKTRAALPPELDTIWWGMLDDTPYLNIFKLEVDCFNRSNDINGVECQVLDVNNKLVERVYNEKNDVNRGISVGHILKFKKVKCNKVYKFRVRTYTKYYDTNTKKMVKTYGKWSEVCKSIFLECSIKLKFLKIKNKQMMRVSIKPPKVKGVKKYEIWINNHKVKTVKGGKTIKIQTYYKKFKNSGKRANVYVVAKGSGKAFMHDRYICTFVAK